MFFHDLKSDGIESRYMQLFATSDHILLECLCGGAEDIGEFVISGITDDGYNQYSPISLKSWVMDDGTVLKFTVISGLAPGTYQVKYPKDGLISHYFRVTNDPSELDTTTLIQYSHRDNRQRRDAVFIIDGMRYFFDFRVTGGFKDSGWSFTVENEQFVTQDRDIVELFALESTQKKFTMGGQEGVPIQFGELLNRLLTCSYVYFDGVRYARKDASAPEINIQQEGLDSFVFNQQLQQVTNLNPNIEAGNHIIIRRIDDTYNRKTDNNLTRIL